jgi:hypothetical protein
MNINMKWIGMVLILLIAVNVHAQAPLPVTPPVQTFVITGNIAGFNGASATSGAVIASAGMQVTNAISASYVHVGISAINSRYELGVIGYSRTLNSLLGKKISDKLLFDASQIGVTFTGGVGKVLQPKVNGFAETVGIHISHPLTNNMSVQIIGIDFLHGGGHTGFLTRNVTEAVSTGINIHF